MFLLLSDHNNLKITTQEKFLNISRYNTSNLHPDSAD